MIGTTNLMAVLTTMIALSTITTTSAASPCEVTIGQTAWFTGRSWNPGHIVNLGLLSAFHEVNSKGGVKGCTIKLISMDDQYNTTKVVENMNTLLANHPEIIAFIAPSGSPTTAVALPVAAAAERLIIGPATGSSYFRKRFNPWTINMRSSYDDELTAMLNLLVTVKQYRRISILYQNDGFGAPAFEAARNAMVSLKMTLAGAHPYNYRDVAGYDYAQWAKDVWANKPQGLIIFSVTEFFTPLLTELYKLDPEVTRHVTVTMGSWIGDAPQTYYKANPQFDPTNFHVTSITPHPEDESLAVTRRYRKAVQDYLAATSPTTAPTYASLGFEGYLAGRAAIDALKRAEQPWTPNTLRRSFYDTKMFGFEELLAGPFSDDCLYDPGTAEGRSSLCNCNQGLRYVEMTVLNSNHQYVKVGDPLQYTTTECYSLTSMLRRPIVFGTMFANTTVAINNADLLSDGVALETAITGSTKQLPVANIEDNSKAAFAELESYGNDHLLLGGVGAMPLHKVKDTSLPYPIFENIFGPAHLADETFNERFLFMTATLQQEIFAATAFLHSLSADSQTILLVQSNHLSRERNDVGLSVKKVLENSLISNGFPESGAVNGEETFDTAAFQGADQAAAATQFDTFLRDAKSTVSSSSSTVNVFLYGMDVTNGGMMDGLVAFLKSSDASNVRVFLSFTELASLFNQLQENHCPLNITTQLAACDQATHDALSKIHMVTHLPMWTAAFKDISAAVLNDGSTVAYTGTFALDMQAALLTTKNTKVNNAHLYNPLVAMGFWLSQIANFLLVRTRGDASTKAVIEELYRSSVVAINGVVMGPFVNQECAGAESCLCNFGARTVDVFTVSDIFSAVEKSLDAAKPVYEHRFQRCHVTYSLPTSSLTTAQLAGIIAGVASFLMLLTLLPMTIAKIKAAKRVAAAPKDATQPYTLVFTDIQSSTSLWARLPDEMGGALDAHHEIIRKLIQEHNGYEVKTIGDAFMIAFKNADDAVELCVRLQEEFYHFDWAGQAGAPRLDNIYKMLEEEMVEVDGSDTKRAPTHRLPDSLYNKLWSGLRVRCGIHTGIGEFRFDEVTNGYDYYGNVANIAARTEAVGNGGQVCLTKATVAALSRSSNLKMSSLGGVELRGVPDPVEIFQVDEFKLDNGCDASMREYAPLRLDKALEEREGVDDNTGDESGTQDPDHTGSFLAETASRTSHNSLHLSGVLELNCNFQDGVSTMFSTMDTATKTSILRKVAAKWRLKTNMNYEELLAAINRKVVGVITSRSKKAAAPATTVDQVRAVKNTSMTDSQGHVELTSTTSAPPNSSSLVVPDDEPGSSGKYRVEKSQDSYH